MQSAIAATLPLVKCVHCHTPYHAHKSTASLRLTYCSALCEQLDLGFTISDLLKG